MPRRHDPPGSRSPEGREATFRQGRKRRPEPTLPLQPEGRGAYEARSTFSTAISTFSIAISEASDFISGTYHFAGQPS